MRLSPLRIGRRSKPGHVNIFTSSKMTQERSLSRPKCCFTRGGIQLQHSVLRRRVSDRRDSDLLVAAHFGIGMVDGEHDGTGSILLGRSHICCA